MHAKRKKFVRTVTALVDADPTFVSIVSAGASGSPFNLIKQEAPTMGVKIKKRTLPAAAGKSVSRKNANNRVIVDRSPEPTDTRAITKLFYDKSVFDTEDSVREHIENSDFDGDYTITQTDSQFIVSASDIDASRIVKSAEVDTGDEGVVAEVSLFAAAAAVSKSNTQPDDAEDDADDGDGDSSTVQNGQSDDDDDDGAGDDEEGDDDDEAGSEDGSDETVDPDDDAGESTSQTVSKKAAFLESIRKEVDEAQQDTAEETLLKFDFWEVYDSNSSDFMTLLKSGCEDGLAPGFDDVMWTYGTSVRNALAGEGDSVDTVLRKNADDFLSVVLGLHNLFSTILNADVGILQKSDSSLAESASSWAKGFGKSLVEKTERPRAATQSSAAVSVTKSAGSNDIALQVSAALNDALAPLREELSTVVKTVDKISSRRQVSKGITSPDATTSEGDDSATTKKNAATPDAAKRSAERIAKSAFAVQTAGMLR